MMDDKDQRIKDLENAIKIQAAAVKTLETAENRESNRLRKQEVEARQALRQLDSEREMNAILTDEVERLRPALRQAALDERDKIVAWLQMVKDDYRDPDGKLADRVKAGEHLK
jgi:hypothetical protein